LETAQDEVAVVFEDQIRFYDAASGAPLTNSGLSRPVDQFMLFNLKDNSQFILGINRDDLKKPGQTVFAYPSHQLPADLKIEDENIFFTSVNPEQGTLTGYKIGAGWVPMQLWKVAITQEDGERFHQIASQNQMSSDIDHQHFLPTSFINDNIIYKYLD